MYSEKPAERRIVFVHAHPDDETLLNGATMARYAAEGAHVTLVTCTLGEQGEVFVPELAQLAVDQADQLGGYRYTELQAACQVLGVTDFRLLGGVGRYRDSGMMGTSANQHPRALWRAELTEAVEYLVEILEELRPQVLVTYDPNGLYGHPDHIQAHRIAMAAAARVRPAPRVLWCAVPRSLAAAGFDVFIHSSENPFADARSVADLPFVTDDAELSVRFDASAFAGHKRAAMAAHATQVPSDAWLTVLAKNFDVEPMGVEYYRSPPGEGSAPPLDPGFALARNAKRTGPIASDLFAEDLDS